MQLQTVQTTLNTLIRARYPVVWLKTWEEERALTLLKKLGEERKKSIKVWTLSMGINGDQKTRDPVAALDQVLNAEGAHIYVFCDLSPLFKDPLITRKVKDCYLALKTSQKTLILLSAHAKESIPYDLQKLVYYLEVNLPGEEELGELLRMMSTNLKSKITVDTNQETTHLLVKSLQGMTYDEAENAISKSVIERGKLTGENYDVLIAEKQQILKSGLLEYYTAEDLTYLGGLDNLKAYISKRKRAFTKEARAFGLPIPRGILMVGVQGCGKSLAAKCTAHVLKVPLLRLDLGKMFNSLVGQSEENMRAALRIADEIAPCVLWIDEVEKGLAGARGAGGLDSVTPKVFGTLLTWMQEHSTEVFVVATSNDLSQIPEEMLRKGRFDEIFFVDLPSTSEREEIFRIHIAKRKREAKDYDISALAVATQYYTGAEIEQVVIEGLYEAFDRGTELTQEIMEQMAKDMPTLYSQFSDRIDNLREVAKKRYRPASIVSGGGQKIRDLEIGGMGGNNLLN